MLPPAANVTSTSLPSEPPHPAPMMISTNAVATYSRGIRIESLAVEAHSDGVGVLVESTGFADAAGMPGSQVVRTNDVRLRWLRVTAQGRSAIEVREARWVELEACDVRMKDAPSAWP